MSNLYPVAGCRFYIGNAAMDLQSTDFVAGDFSAVTWIEVDGWSQAGAIGDQATQITTSLINRNRDIAQKGTAQNPGQQHVFAIIPGDAGQAAIRAAGAAGNKSNYPFQVLLNDPTGSPATASKRYFVGLVMSAQETMGEANTIQNLNVQITQNSNLVEVAAGE